MAPLDRSDLTEISCGVMPTVEPSAVQAKRSWRVRSVVVIDVGDGV
jgi:hypothetical protein